MRAFERSLPFITIDTGFTKMLRDLQKVFVFVDKKGIIITLPRFREGVSNYSENCTIYSAEPSAGFSSMSLADARLNRSSTCSLSTLVTSDTTIIAAIASTNAGSSE